MRFPQKPNPTEFPKGAIAIYAPFLLRGGIGLATPPFAKKIAAACRFCISQTSLILGRGSGGDGRASLKFLQVYSKPEEG